MKFPKAKIVPLGDVNIAVYEAGPRDGVPILLIHGWPEIAYSWAHQIWVLAEAGYRVIAMDLRGFGHSSAPLSSHEYGIEKIVGDIEGVLDALGIEQVVLCGHDWGGIIVWHAARMIENRVKGVIGVCTPHVKQAPIDPMEIFERRHGKDHYFVAFKEIGMAEAVFEQDVLAFFRMMFRTVPDGAQPSSEMYHLVKKFKQYVAAGVPALAGQVMSDEDLQVYAGAFSHSGFHGGINLYRNTTPNWEYGASLSPNVTQPSLMISAARDLYLPPEFTEQMVETVPDLERYTIEDCGHWAMWEQPQALNSILLDWLERRF
ncbi:MAG: epoxide hydrolase [Robiginitomaculum sp.]|nr:MAG: epoxide hydrolase [Robiginitomaculum sp.]